MNNSQLICYLKGILDCIDADPAFKYTEVDTQTLLELKLQVDRTLQHLNLPDKKFLTD